MIELLNIRGRKRRLSSVLGLSLDGSRLEGAVVRRTNGSLQIQQPFSVTLSLDPLTADAELVGREIRNHLDAAGVRERHCVVGLPLKWALTTVVDVPELPAEDVEGFLQIEAERGFHADVSTLHFASSVVRFSGGKQQALLVGIPKTHLEAWQKVLRAAKLKPVSFGLGMVAAGGKEASIGVLSVSIGDTQVGLAVTAGGGIAALRGVEGALVTEGGKKMLNADLIAREARITLGQLPAELRDTIKRIRISGPRDLAQQLADEMELRFEPMGLKAEVVGRYAPNEFGVQLPPETAVSPAISMAAMYLAGSAPAFELLPPRVTAWRQAAARYSTGKWKLAGAAAGIALLILLAAFGFQQWQLSRYQSEWQSMAVKVGDLQGVSDQIHRFRPWYDDSMRALTILKQLTTAFPEDGSVSAKTIEIRDLSAVTCMGTTRDRAGVIKVFEALRASPGVEVRMGPIRGTKPPMQFTFDVHWPEGAKLEN
jgi:hypothetical protein